MPNLLSSRRNQLIAGAVALLLIVAGVVVATSGGDEAPEATTTTTEATTTTTEATTTTAPAPTAPLTGLPGLFEGRTERPALAVKIDNVEPRSRPQAGINQADVVFEERVEGSVTRLLAVFHSTDAAPIGPVRSARTSDIGIYSALGKPYFAWSGANAGFAQRIRASNIVDVGYDAASSQYYREPGRPGTHNLMMRSSVDVLSIPSEGSGPPPPLFTYLPAGEKPDRLQPVSGVRITYGNLAGSAPVEYRWNGKGWARTQAGTPHVDTNGVQVAPENVIVQFTPYGASGGRDQQGKEIPEAELVGEGDAWILTQGGIIGARWTKANLVAPTSYFTPDGKRIALTPGRTWVALPQPGGAVQL